MWKNRQNAPAMFRFRSALLDGSGLGKGPAHRCADRYRGWSPAILSALWLAVWGQGVGCTRPCPTRVPYKVYPDACCGSWDVGPGDSGFDAGTDAEVDGRVPQCHLRYESCHIGFGPLEVGSGEVQDPDLAYGDGRILVTYLDYDDFGGATIAGYSLTGTELFRDRDVGGLNGPTIAWNRELSVGLMAADCGVCWLGSDGRPIGQFQEVPLAGGQCYAEVAPVPGGFAVVASQSGYVEGSSVLVGGALLGAAPAPFSWETILEGDLPWWPFRSALDEEGWGRYFVSSAWSDYGNGAVAFVVGEGGMTSFDLEKPGMDQGLMAAAVHAGSLYLVWRPESDTPNRGWLERVSPHRLWRLETGQAWANTALLNIGRDLVVLEQTLVGAQINLVMSRLDLTRNDDPRVDSQTLSTADTGWSLQAVDIPGHGFAAVWGGGGVPVEMMYVDCCSQDAR